MKNQVKIACAQALLAGLALLLASREGQAQGLQSQIPAAEYNALIDIYNSTGGASWGDSSGWTNPLATSWYGVGVSGGHVTSLALAANGLSGTIPPSLGNLTKMTDLDFEANNLAGPMPSTLGNLTQLTDLNLIYDALTGSIPTNLGSLSQVQYLSLYGNDLTGNIPASMGNLSSCTYLDFGDNQLTGSIPSSLGNLTELTFLNFAPNKLTGSIPSSLGNLVNLTDLDFEANFLTGSIPSTFGNLTQLQGLLFVYNNLTGTIPTNLGNLTKLTDLDCYGNRLTGPIPGSFVNLTNLGFLRLSLNELSGDVPDLTGITKATIDVTYNYLIISAGSQSLSNIQAMITAGNTVDYMPQYSAPVLGPITYSGGEAQVGITAEPGMYIIQASTDLTNWGLLTNVTMTNSSSQFLDSSAGLHPHRFYRAMVPP